MSLRERSRIFRLAVLPLALALPLTAIPLASALAEASAADRAQQADAKKKLADGDKAARAKDWEKAAVAYADSYAASASAAALFGLAGARYELKQVVEAYEAYDELMKTYAGKLAHRDKATAQARLKELGNKTGNLSIRVSEAGAQVSLDGRSIGTTPIPALLRVPVGPHKIAIAKEGFDPFESQNLVGAGGKEIVDVTLTRSTKTSKIVVREKKGQPLRVIVDGVDVGQAPWEGELPFGPHDVSGRGTAINAAKQTVDVAKGKTTEVELEASAFIARLEVRTADGAGIILLDGKPVAEGTYVGELPVGAHVFSVSREGFERYEKRVVLENGQTLSEMVTLRRSTRSEVEKESSVSSNEGVYGGFYVLGYTTPGGLGTDLEVHCNALGAASCKTPSPKGGGAFGYFGYSWNPVGLELFLGGSTDVTTQKATFDGKAGPNMNPQVVSPPREESFLLLRFGGVAAARVRVSVQTKALRASLAGGVGVAYRYVQMKREANATDGSGMQDIPYIPSGASYLSPAISFDASAQLRLGPNTAVMLGALFWAENAGADARSSGDSSRALRSAANPAGVPLSTPAYQLAMSTQLFLGPYIGMQFGP